MKTIKKTEQKKNLLQDQNDTIKEGFQPEEKGVKMKYKDKEEQSCDSLGEETLYCASTDGIWG